MNEDAKINAVLSFRERFALASACSANENHLFKLLQSKYLKFMELICHQIIKNSLHVDGFESLTDLNPDRGILFCSNHRSFFDQFALSSCLYRNTRWIKAAIYPVRSEFFYDTFFGMCINAFWAGFSMYPPIFRQKEKIEYNKIAVETILRFLKTPGVFVGMHPEGTRNKGKDPYQLLRAMPGVGEVIMKAQPIVIPVFINGLSNSMTTQIKRKFQNSDKKQNAVILCVGNPIDFTKEYKVPPRPTQYKLVADKVVQEIQLLGSKEKAIREKLV